MLTFSMLALTLLTQACSFNQNKNADADGSSTHASSANTMKNGGPVDHFLEEAAISGLIKLEMGKVGQQKASLKSIKDFSAKIVKDQVEANAQLRQLALKRGIYLPAELSDVERDHVNDIKRAMNKDFDNYYINMMVEDHMSDISLFKGAANSADTALSALAEEVLPVLQKNYEESRDISNQIDSVLVKKN